MIWSVQFCVWIFWKEIVLFIYLLNCCFSRQLINLFAFDTCHADKQGRLHAERNFGRCRYVERQLGLDIWYFLEIPYFCIYQKSNTRTFIYFMFTYYYLYVTEWRMCIRICYINLKSSKKKKKKKFMWIDRNRGPLYIIIIFYQYTHQTYCYL